jgi:DNA-binding response OmpR family regulator
MDRDRVTDFAKWLRDEPRVAKFLMLLLETPGKAVPHTTVLERIVVRGNKPQRAAIAMANRLRQSLGFKLGPGEWVETDYGYGYRVTAKTAKKILEEMEK